MEKKKDIECDVELSSSSSLPLVIPSVLVSLESSRSICPLISLSASYMRAGARAAAATGTHGEQEFAREDLEEAEEGLGALCDNYEE